MEIRNSQYIYMYNEIWVILSRILFKLLIECDDFNITNKNHLFSSFLVTNNDLSGKSWFEI